MDGTKNPQDALGVTPDPSAGKRGTSEKEPETFTKEERDKAVSDALSKAGRTAKTFSELQQKLETGVADLTARQTKWQKERDEAEEFAVRDNPEALTELQERRRRKVEDETRVTELTTRETKLAEREAELADIVEQHRILKRTELAAEVAVEKGVSIDAILKLAKEDTREAYEAVAEVLPKVKEPLVLKPDSGRTIGGTNWRDLTTDQKIARGLSQK